MHDCLVKRTYVHFVHIMHPPCRVLCLPYYIVYYKMQSFTIYTYIDAHYKVSFVISGSSLYPGFIIERSLTVVPLYVEDMHGQERAIIFCAF